MNKSTMNKKYEIFFGTSGLTSTSANHIANKIKEYLRVEETALANMSLVSSEVELLVANKVKQVSTGMDNAAVEKIRERLQFMGKCKALAAWLREAIKCKENAVKDAKLYEFEQWCKDNNKEVPVMPAAQGVLSEDDVIAQMSVDERVKYYSLEAKAAVLGKAIHSNGFFAEARAEFLKRLTKPVEVSGRGSDAMVYTYTPSADKEVVEKTYMEINEKHRMTQAQLNKMLHDIDTAVKESVNEANERRLKEIAEYSTKYSAMQAEFSAWQHKETSKMQALKIVIPEALQETYEMIKNL